MHRAQTAASSQGWRLKSVPACRRVVALMASAEDAARFHPGYEATGGRMEPRSSPSPRRSIRLSAHPGMPCDVPAAGEHHQGDLLGLPPRGWRERRADDSVSPGQPRRASRSCAGNTWPGIPVIRSRRVNAAMAILRFPRRRAGGHPPAGSPAPWTSHRPAWLHRPRRSPPGPGRQPAAPGRRRVQQPGR